MSAVRPKRAPIDLSLDDIKWEPIPRDADWDGDLALPFATHRGVLHIGEVTLRVYQLNDGMRVIDADDAARFFGLLGEEGE